jgi:hypothetical protein
VNTLLLFTCAMKNQTLTIDVTVRRIFVVDLTIPFLTSNNINVYNNMSISNHKVTYLIGNDTLGEYL